MNLKHVSFTKNDLMHIREEDAIFLLNIGSILQEISTLHKLIKISSKNIVGEIERGASNFQVMYFSRLLASTLYESWKLLEHRRYKQVIVEYEPNLELDANTAIRELRHYFSNTNNTCSRIRNNFSYHYNYGKIRNAYQQWNSDEKMDMYVSNIHGNCLYTASDMITTVAMLEATSIEDIVENLPTLLTEIVKVAKWFIILLGDILSQIVFKVMDQGAPQIEDMTISDPPRLEDMKLNFFVAER